MKHAKLCRVNSERMSLESLVKLVSVSWVLAAAGSSLTTMAPHILDLT